MVPSIELLLGGGGGGGGEHNTLKAPMCYYSLGKLCSEKYSREPATAVL